MKKFFIALSLYFGLVFCSFGQTSPENEIKSVLERQANNWNRGDINKFMEDYWHSDSLQFVGKDEILYGWQATLDRYLRTYSNKELMGNLEFSNLKIDVLSDSAAFVLGRWDLKRPLKGDVGGYFSLLLKKIDNSWKIVIDHTS